MILNNKSFFKPRPVISSPLRKSLNASLRSTAQGLFIFTYFAGADLGTREVYFNPGGLSLSNKTNRLLNSSGLGLLRHRLVGPEQRSHWGHRDEFIIRGIGYKFRFYRLRGETFLSFRLGYAHRILYPLSETFEFRTNRRFDFLVSSFSQKVFRATAEGLRGLRATDIYKGKGIKYDRAPLILKPGKVR